MMLWVDKHQPRALDKIIAHEEIAQNLKKLGRSPKTLRQVSVHDCPGLLFYGPTGSGKKTLVMALLKQMFGPGVKLENKMWKIDTGTHWIELELTMLLSTHHVDMNPSDAGFQDRYPFTVNQALPPLDWEQYVSEIASDIMKEQSPKRNILRWFSTL
ncbi:Replication factor C subunit [Musa troglodytarum]|uniref:Replication factor C subunit n=1 Tax=Musa troglodytarum TaxID=320322 RepID=A0A9E7FZ67_9LILI|nr:Replication factor C subunit [Musa troglodytarum]